MRTVKLRPVLAGAVLLLALAQLSVPVLASIPPLDSSSESESSSSSSSTSDSTRVAVVQTDGVDTDLPRREVSDSEVPEIPGDVAASAESAPGAALPQPSQEAGTAGAGQQSAATVTQQPSSGNNLPVSGSAMVPKVAMAITGAAFLTASVLCGKNRKKD